MKKFDLFDLAIELLTVILIVFGGLFGDCAQLEPTEQVNFATGEICR